MSDDTDSVLGRQELLETFFEETADVNDFLYEMGQPEDEFFDDVPPEDKPPNKVDNFALAVFYTVRAWSHFDRAATDEDGRVDDLETLAAVIETAGDMHLLDEYRNRK